MLPRLIIPASRTVETAMKIMVKVGNAKVRIDILSEGGELMSGIRHTDAPLLAEVKGTEVKISNYGNLINSKLKSAADRVEPNDLLDLEFLVDNGKDQFDKKTDLDIQRVKAFCETFGDTYSGEDSDSESTKARRKKIAKGIESKSAMDRLKHTYLCQ